MEIVYINLQFPASKIHFESEFVCQRHVVKEAWFTPVRDFYFRIQIWITYILIWISYILNVDLRIY